VAERVTSWGWAATVEEARAVAERAESRALPWEAGERFGFVGPLALGTLGVWLVDQPSPLPAKMFERPSRGIVDPRPDSDQETWSERLDQHRQPAGRV